MTPSYDTSCLATLPDVLTPRQVCSVLQIKSRPDRVLRERLQPAGLPVIKLPGGLRVLKSDLLQWLQGLRQESGLSDARLTLTKP
jgi:hypothetical protein